jgi:PAS domain S-box-containing protein
MADCEYAGLMDINYLDKRKSGLSLVGDVTWGSSFCQFYQNREDILEILVPYFKAGLENNELCVLVTEDGASIKDIESIISGEIPDIRKDQFEIVSLKRWIPGRQKPEKSILIRLEKAISRGCDGVRLAFEFSPGNDRMVPISHDVVESVNRFNTIAAIFYPRDNFDAVGIMEVVKNHHGALIKNSGKWEVIESSEARVDRNALTRAEEKLRVLFSHMAEGFAYHRIVLDGKGKPSDYIFLEVNDAFENMLGLKVKDLIGKRVTQIIPGIETDATDWIGKYGGVALSGKPIKFESYSDALKRWYSVSAFSPSRGFFAVTFNDITERKEAEEDLKINNERLSILSEANSLLLSSGDPQRMVQIIAKKVMEHLDCDCFFNFIADENAGKLRLNAYAGIPAGTAKSIEWLNYGEAICGCAARDGCRIVSENIQENGDMRAELVRSFGVQAYAAHPLAVGLKTVGTLSFGTRSRTHFDEDELDLMKTIAGQVSVAMARKLVEDDLKRYAVNLETANRELESFSYTVSHDLRAPLRSMDGYSNALLEDYANKLDSQGKTWLQNIRSSSIYMGRLIDDILGLSRVIRTELKFEEVDLSEIARTEAVRLKKEEPRRRVEFTIEKGVQAVGDINLLGLVIQNLLGNAFKFTLKNQSARIEFGLDRQNGTPVYFVRDNGAGFDMKYVDKLFTAFQRLHSDRDYPGTGIGLATVQKIIQRHDGRVWAEGEVNRGATFFFTLNQERQ